MTSHSPSVDPTTWACLAPSHQSAAGTRPTPQSTSDSLNGRHPGRARRQVCPIALSREPSPLPIVPPPARDGMVDTVSTQHPSQSAPWWMGATRCRRRCSRFGIRPVHRGRVRHDGPCSGSVSSSSTTRPAGLQRNRSRTSAPPARATSCSASRSLCSCSPDLGEQALKRGDRFGVGGFFAFGLLGGWAAARNPQSSFIAGWFWAPRRRRPRHRHPARKLLNKARASATKMAEV